MNYKDKQREFEARRITTTFYDSGKNSRLDIKGTPYINEEKQKIKEDRRRRKLERKQRKKVIYEI